MSIQLKKLFQNTEIDLTSLTPRELDVLSCLLQNSASKKIAPILQITIETVDTHIANIGRKLGQNGRAQIVDCLRSSVHATALHQRYASLVKGPEFEKSLRRLKNSTAPFNLNYSLDYKNLSLKKLIAKTQHKSSLWSKCLLFIGWGVLSFVL